MYHRTNDLNNKSVPKQIADYIISQAKSVKSDENCVFASGLTTRADSSVYSNMLNSGRLHLNNWAITHLVSNFCYVLSKDAS